MKKVLTMLMETNKRFKQADHLTYVTYPVLKDIHLLNPIMNSLLKSLVGGMNTILVYDELYKRIPPQPENFNSRLETFRTKCAPRYSIDDNSLLLIKAIKEIAEHRMASPIEFKRRDQLVICSDNYRIKTISYEKVKEYVNKTKAFIIKVNGIIKRAEGYGG